MDNLITIPQPEARWRFGRSSPSGIIWSKWSKNTICKGFGNLVGALLSMPVNPDIPITYGGPLYIAVGEGDWTGSWDFPSSPPPIAPDTALLTAELDRTEVSFVGYRQEPAAGHPITDGAILDALSTTNYYRPIFGASWSTSEAISPHGLREVGLFGGPGADTTNDGLLLNTFRYQVQNKTSTDPYALHWEVEFKINWS